MRTISVFGASDWPPEDHRYREAVTLGRFLTEQGWRVYTGGYGGSMEAVCRGAREAGGAPVGVTVEAFQFRGGPNRYVAREIRATDLYERTRRLIDSADAFLVLEGKAGTLAEVSFVWALNRAGLLDGPCPVFLYGAGWEPLYRFLERSGALTEVAGNGAGCTEWITDLELLQERILAYGQERTRA